MIGIPLLLTIMISIASLLIVEWSTILDDKYAYQSLNFFGENMNLSQEIINNDSGEVISRKNIPNNRDFVMTYRIAYQKLRELGLKDAKARVLFDFFLEKMNQDNALIVSRQTLAEFLGWSVPTVDRKIKVLRDERCIDIKKSGTSNVYLINADLAWTTYANRREYAEFRAAVFIGASEQDGHSTYELESENQKNVYLNSDS